MSEASYYTFRLAELEDQIEKLVVENRRLAYQYREISKRNIPKNTIFKKYPRVYKIIVAIARRHGYAAAIHGSQTRDLDIILIPWVDNVSRPEEVVKDICINANLYQRVSDPSASKPHGRLVWTLSKSDVIPGGWIDLGVMQTPVNYVQQQQEASDYVL